MQQADYDRWIAPIRERMVNCVWRIVRDANATEDVIQDVLLQVLSDADAVARHRNPPALLLRICTNKALDHLRRQSARHAAMQRFSAVPNTNRGLNPLQGLMQAERRAELINFLKTLPEREAEAITLHALEEMEYAEIAAAMECSPSTVRVLIGRARSRFRDAFGPERAGRPARDGELSPEWRGD